MHIDIIYLNVHSTHENYLHNHKLHFSHDYCLFQCISLQTIFFYEKYKKENWDFYIKCKLFKQLLSQSIFIVQLPLPSGLMGKETWEQSYKHVWRYKVCWSSGMEQSHKEPFIRSHPRGGLLPGRWVCYNQGLWVTEYTMPSKVLILPVLPQVLNLSP